MVHEVAHGYAALICGDRTALNQGRLTINPIRHIDPIGSVMLPLMLILSGSGFLFGWAKPVPVNTNQLNNPADDMVKVAVAGPLSNITLAVIVSVAIKVILAINPLLQVTYLWVFQLLGYAVVINIVLAVFNLIPIPPMDGSRILYRWLPYNARSFFDRIEPYGFLIIIVLAFLGSFQLFLILFVRH